MSLDELQADPEPKASGWKLALGPALAALVLVLGPGETAGVARMAAIAVWMATWWATEAVPIPVTALLPLVLIPAAGIQSMAELSPLYTRSTVFLFLGGFLLAIGLSESGVHRRFALGIVQLVGGTPRRVILGFMLASALLSMWISNTATVMVLLPIVLSVIEACQVEPKGEGFRTQLQRHFAIASLLAIAYAADIGGMATLVGTPPNLVYAQQLNELFPGAPVPSFAEWMTLGLPLSIVFLACGWLLLVFVLFRDLGGSLFGSDERLHELRRALGPLRRDELLGAATFATCALLWITRVGLDFGAVVLPGWQDLPFVPPGKIDDATVAIAMAILLFMLPSKDRPGEHLLEWRMAKQVPWGMLLLFGGGFALAEGFGASGLSSWVAGHFSALAGAPPVVVIAVVCLVLTFLTEFTSNTATTQMVLPILAAAAVALGIDPRALMIPATLSASCAFMMPVASPTQAVVFSSGLVPIREMMRAGLWFNLLGVALVVLFFALFGGPILGIDFGVLPDWATLAG